MPNFPRGGRPSVGGETVFVEVPGPRAPFGGTPEIVIQGGGLLAVGAVLDLNDDSEGARWQGDAPISFARQLLADGEPITTATAITVTQEILDADVLVLRVVATNGVGPSAPTFSEPFYIGGSGAGEAPVFPIPVGGSPRVALTQGGTADYLNIAALFTSPPGTTYALAAASASALPNSWTFEAGIGVLITDTSLVAPTLTLTFDATYEGRTVSQTLDFEPGFIAVAAQGQPADLALTVGTAMTPVDLGAFFDGDRPLTIDADPGYTALPAWMTLTATTVNGQPTTLLGGTPTAAVAATTLGIRARNTGPDGTVYSDSVSFGLQVRTSVAAPTVTRHQAVIAESTAVGWRIYRSPGALFASGPVFTDTVQWLRVPVGTTLAPDAVVLPAGVVVIADQAGTEYFAIADDVGFGIARRTVRSTPEGDAASNSNVTVPITALIVAPTALGGVTVPDLTVGVLMTPVDFNPAFGGTKPQTVTLDATSDALPPGLALADGILSGTPTTVDAAVNLVLRSTNPSGFITVSDSFVIAASAVVNVRTFVDGLVDNTTTRGRTSINTLKAAGTMTLPAGMTRSGTTITIDSYSGTPADYEDVDFRDFMVNVRAVIPAIRQCLFGQTSMTTAPLYPLQIEGGGDVALVEFCSFQRTQSATVYTPGPSTQVHQKPTISGGVITAYGKLRTLRRCSFIGRPEDCLKLLGDARTGGQLIEENYFGPASNLPSATLPKWDSATTYGLGVIVTAGASTDYAATGNYEYRSLQAGNVGHTPPGLNNTDAWWASYDRHADSITTVAVFGSLTVKRNLFDDRTDPPGALGPFYNQSINNWMRISRNTGTSYPLGRVDVVENVAYRYNIASFPVEVKDGGQPGFDGPINFTGNWWQRQITGSGANGGYFSTDTNGMVDVWSNNRDSITDALIVGPTGSATTPVTTYPERISIGLLGRSNLDYLTLTDNGANYQNAGIQRPSIPASPVCTFYGQNALANRHQAIFSRRIDNVSGSMDSGINPEINTNGTTTTNRGIMNIAMMTIAEWWCHMAAQEGWPTALDLVDLAKAGAEQTNLLNDDKTGMTFPWPWADFIGTLNLVGRELDLTVQKWNYAATGGSSDKRGYLRLANTAAPAAPYTPGSVASIDRTFWDLNIAAGTKEGTNPPAFSTNTNLAVVPEDSVDLRTTLKTMMADADWLRVLRPNFLGRYDSFAAQGGHAYSDSVAGQVLGAMTIIMPHIISYLYSRGMVDVNLVQLERVGWTVAADRLSATCYIEMANGGDFYSPRETWGIPFPANPLADHQLYNYFFIQRSGEADAAITPIMRLGSTGAANHQGTVSLVSRGATVPSVTLTDGAVVTNGRFAQVLLTFPSGQALATGDRLHTGHNHWSWIDTGSDPIPQQPALDIPKEFIASLAPAACLRRWVGVDLGKYQGPFIVPVAGGGSGSVGEPVVVQDFLAGAGTTRLEGAPFTFDSAKRYLASISYAGPNGSTIDTTKLTLGTQGRAAGVGVLARPVGSDGEALYRKNVRTESHLFAISGVSGAQTLAFESGSAERSARIILMEVPGWNGNFGEVSLSAINTNSQGGTRTLTTTANGSRMLMLLSKADGQAGNIITVAAGTGAGQATQLVEGASSAAPSATDVRVGIFHKPTPTPTSYSITYASASNTAAASITVELLPA